jgi:hypothetical protein
MNSNLNTLQQRLRLSGILLIGGLLLEAICLSLRGALPFVTFVSVGGLLLAAGVLVYFRAVLSFRAKPSDD